MNSRNMSSSPVTLCKTLAVLEPPNMQVYALNSTAVHVRWRPNNPDHHGIAGYQLDVLSIRNEQLRRLIFIPETLQETIPGLGAYSNLCSPF